jgi:hypothetical protein
MAVWTLQWASRKGLSPVFSPAVAAGRLTSESTPLSAFVSEPGCKCSLRRQQSSIWLQHRSLTLAGYARRRQNQALWSNLVALSQ